MGCCDQMSYCTWECRYLCSSLIFALFALESYFKGEAKCLPREILGDFIGISMRKVPGAHSCTWLNSIRLDLEEF